MSKQSRISSAAVLMAMTAAVCSAQSVTSAHSGTLHYFEGDVSIDGATVQTQKGRFQEIKEQGVLRTGLGRAEVLLTPGVFLRVGENSSIKLLDNRLISTRVEVLSGTVMVESDDPQMTIKDSPVTLIYKDYDIQMVKHGVVEISSDPAQLKVYKGEALVSTATDRASVKEGHLVPFSAALLAEKFDEKIGDDLYLWTRDRSQSLSAASMASARSLSYNGFGGGSGYSSSPGIWNSGWFYNQYLGMYSFVPGAGTYFNPWGYGFFSPGTVYNYYAPTTYWYGGGGARGTGSVGRPVIVAGNPSSGRPAPLSTLRGGNNTGMPALGSPLRGGNTIGVPAAGNQGSFASGSRGGGVAAASSASGGGGGRTSFSGGGGGHASGGVAANSGGRGR
ncbi:MAG TPA: hypothetical protein VHZ74_05890 [Bryobacteraceae bacterium]|jgi:hypothetical protein|nr:hypothetical protein [Bryobacteraceae bacterium]